MGTRRRTRDRGCGKVPRRAFLADLGMGFTGLALGTLLYRDSVARGAPSGKPERVPKAKSVIWLFMMGGVSHVESFDPKPALDKYSGKTIAETPYKSILDSPFSKETSRGAAVLK